MTPVLESPISESPAQETNDMVGAKSPRSARDKKARRRNGSSVKIPSRNSLVEGLESARESASNSSEIPATELKPSDDGIWNEFNIDSDAASALSLTGTSSLAILESERRTAEGRTSWPLLLLPIEAIGPNPFQPREEFDEVELEELAASVKEHGVQSPVIVRTARSTANALGEGSAQSNVPEESVAIATPVFTFELIAGERRLRASRLAKVKFIPVIVRDDLSDAQAAELALVENVQRSNLNIIEEGRGYRRLMLKFRFTEKRISKKVGKGVPTIQAAIKLLELPEEVQTLLLKKQLSAAHGHELLRLASYPEICVGVALRAQVEKITASSLSQNILPNAQQLKRRGQVVELGYATKFAWRIECQSCPFKAFVSSGHSAYCLRPDEWRRKQDHAIELEKQEAARILEAARREGESSVSAADLPSGSYCNLVWNEPPAGCSPACECRGRIADPQNAAKSIPICLKPERFKELQREQRLAQEAERKRHYGQLASAAFAGIASLPVSVTVPCAVAGETNGELDHELVRDEDTSPHQVENYEPAVDVEGPDPRSLAPLREAVSPEHDLGEMAARSWMPEDLDLHKIAPLLVLPALAGSHGDHYGDRNWEEMVERTARELHIDLPLDEIMGQIDDAVALRRLEAVDPMSLLLLGAAVLIRQEAEHAARWEGETPRLQFVLGLQRGEQREMELKMEMEMEMESEDGCAEAAVPDDPTNGLTGGETDLSLEPKAVAGPLEERNPDDMKQSEDNFDVNFIEEPVAEERGEAQVTAAKVGLAEYAIEGSEHADDDAIIAALEMEQEEEYAESA